MTEVTIYKRALEEVLDHYEQEKQQQSVPISTQRAYDIQKLRSIIMSVEGKPLLDTLLVEYLDNLKMPFGYFENTTSHLKIRP